ncbi:hypothetical protein K5549_020774, partial [Capra hircus]
GLLLQDEAPNFEVILFSHPRDFTPVCTTELGRAAKLAPEFAKRKIKMIALSIDSVKDYLAWSKDINTYNEKLCFPITDDKNGDLAIQLGMLDPAENDKKGMPVTAHVAFVFGPDNKPKLSILYSATTGRNFDEILFPNGDSMMVLPTIPEEEAKKIFPKGVFSPKSSHLARNTSTTPLAIGSLWSWCWSCPPNTVSQRTAAVHHVSPQQAIKNILM